MTQVNSTEPIADLAAARPTAPRNDFVNGFSPPPRPHQTSGVSLHTSPKPKLAVGSHNADSEPLLTSASENPQLLMGKTKKTPPPLFGSPLSHTSENDSASVERKNRSSPQSVPSVHNGITPSTCTSPAVSNQEASEILFRKKNATNKEETFPGIPLVDEVDIATPTSSDSPALNMKPKTENSRAITIDTTLGRGATLRDLVFNQQDDADSTFRNTEMNPRDEGEGILDQPITTPTARTPVRRMSFVNFNPPRSPTGARNLHSNINRNRPSLSDGEGFGVYPPMPDGCSPPCPLPALVPIRLLDIPPPQSGMVQYFPETDTVGEQDTALDPAVSGPIHPNRVIENKICVGVILKNVELRNCHVTNCKLQDSIVKGGYHSGCVFKNCDVASALCVVSSVFDQSFATLCIITNCHFQQGGIKESRVMDSIIECSGVFYCRLTRCAIKYCEFFDIEQIECPFIECDPEGDIDRYFEPPKRHTSPQKSHRSSKRKASATRSSATPPQRLDSNTNEDNSNNNNKSKNREKTDNGLDKECEVGEPKVDKKDMEAADASKNTAAVPVPPSTREQKVGKSKFFCCS